MKEPVFCGVCTALITPFTETGGVNFPCFNALIDRQLEAGVDAICVCGTTGESATLTPREHRDLIRACVDRVDGRAKVVAGTGSNSTAAALTLSREAQDLGADALLLVTPYYNKTTQTGLIKHYEFIADRVDVPIILYNVPSRTGLSCAAETYQALSKHPRINGVKEASGNFSLIARTKALCGPELNIWSGNDDQTVPIMALGGQGVISVYSNLLPKQMIRIARLCLDGDFHAAAALQETYMELMDALFIEVNPIPIKAALAMAGVAPEHVRLPLWGLSPSHRKVLREAMERTGVLRERSFGDGEIRI